MENSIKYVHTNIIAKDWKRLANFYIDVFQCTPVYPERNLKGEWLDKLTKINNVNIKGIHLSLPGYENGPTLEIFGYEPNNLTGNKPIINRQGLGHLAFHVDSVKDVLEKLVTNGGEQLGELVIQDYGTLGILTVVYTRDPEGNIIELQNWAK
ncbi:glyoxalase/bleomycin resistance protein/dihydroxybiphenyl dioxygenase [Lucifera butyrica]|uniref:Glyoxalase/bleomycin resistance protein/dihydroxybiphenyl dioxygenase n=1 Tax=Lucifera butyrica TaxID=1351585 RepID=A0A498RDX4_9FIRM|nr:VOC family protein [Lucifera butyrica]VBB09529.1 glyoxalase/bleomycin resistance protein/dihydroxybiphenyl dioxygenase [Lucifera butyrica]